MNKTQHLAYNSSLSSSQLVDLIAANIANYGKPGMREQRWAFNDYLNGGHMEKAGVSWSQGKQMPRVGEPTKMMIRGRGLFTVEDPRTSKTMYTRLGDFHIDGHGNLVTKEGFMVQGEPLAGNYTDLGPIDPTSPKPDFRNSNLYDPYNDPYTNNRKELNPAGKAVGAAQDVNLKIDPRNGLYLGQYDRITVQEDGVIYGVSGNDLVSLYKLKVVSFNNPEGLRDAKDSTYWEPSPESGLPSLAAGESKVIGEALEMNNAWLKKSTNEMKEAQRMFQAATQLHKIGDKMAGSSIELLQ